MSGTLDRAAHYVIHERLASGGMGEVFLGTMASPAGNRPIAVKQVAADRLRMQEAVERLVAEAKLGFQLRHANICQVLDLVVGAKGVFLILEFVEGVNLRTLVKTDQQPLEVSIALHAARETARALDYAHRARSGEGGALHLVHGDVTPQNILMSVEGEVKLADFGIARALGAASPGSNLVGGTRGFMAPEVLSGSVDHRSDIYSLGATLHYALVGQAPATPGDCRALAGREDLSANLRGLVARCLAPQVERRYASAAELEADLALEMARRFPEFTPSVAARRVRAASGLQARRGHEPAATLFTIGSEGRTLALDNGQSARVEAPWLVEEALPSPSPIAALHAASSSIPAGQGTMTLHHKPSTGGGVSKRSMIWLALALTACFGAVLLLWGPWRSDGTAGLVSERADAASAITPPTQIVLRRSNEVDAGAIATRGPVDAGVLTSSKPDASVKTSRPIKNRARHEEPGFLSVHANPWGSVEVDGRIVAEETPLLRVEMAPGRHRVTVIFGDGSRSKTRRIVLKPGQSQNLGFSK